MILKLKLDSNLPDLLKKIQDNLQKKQDFNLIIRGSVPANTILNNESILEMITEIIQEWCEKSKIEYFAIENITITTLALRNISYYLEQQNTLINLKLDKLGITNDGAREIAKIINNNKKIQELSLSGNEITEEGLGDIFDALKGNITPKRLILSHNPIESLTFISKLEDVPIELLDLEQCKIRHLNEDFFNLINDRNFKKIDLSGNIIDLSNPEVQNGVEQFCREVKSYLQESISTIDFRSQKSGTDTTDNQQFYQQCNNVDIVQVGEAVEGSDNI